MDWEKVGEVVHYFDRISVAAVILEDTLAVGDWIAFVWDGELIFEQEVASMQIDHVRVTVGYTGDNVGLQVRDLVKLGVEVYKQGTE